MERDKINAGLARNPPNCGRTGGYPSANHSRKKRTGPTHQNWNTKPVQPIKTGKSTCPTESDPPRDLSVSNHSKKGLSICPTVRTGIQHLTVVSNQSELEHSICSSIYKQSVKPLALLRPIRAGSRLLLVRPIKIPGSNKSAGHLCSL
jgi:hypothetical protein